MRILRSTIPLVEALRGYERRHAQADLGAGLTTAVMLIPQAMGYAMLAGLPPLVGLYASVLPLLVYALIGTSRQLAVGPVAMDSLLVAAGVAPLAAGDPATYLHLTLLLAVMVGLLQSAMGLFRLGFLVNFLSYPVISGFTSAAALIIASSQLTHLLGVSIPRSNYVHRALQGALSQLDAVHGITVAIGVSSVAALVALKRYAPRFPRALVVVAASSVLVGALGLDGDGVAIVGSVPRGLPSLTTPRFDVAAVQQLIPIALTLALLGFMEATAIGKKYARAKGYRLSANRELIAVGAANFTAGFSGGYPITGGFSRTAVNASAGATTQLAGVITAFAVALTLVFFTPLFYYLPKAVLAAIIITAVVGLIDIDEAKHVYRVRRADLALLGATFGATLSLGIIEGMAVGVAASLGMLIWRSTHPHVAVLGHIGQGDVFRNVNRFACARTVPGVLALRLDAQLYFGNVNFLEETIDSHISRQNADAPAHRVEAVVLDASGINQLDASGELAVRGIDDDLDARGIKLFLADVKGPVRDVMKRSGLWAKFEGRIFYTVGDAVRVAEAWVQSTTEEERKRLLRRGHDDCMPVASSRPDTKR
ncbi:MAG: sulfate permease [Myxococcota bacterium]